MLTGTVDPFLNPIFRIVVRGPQGQERTIEPKIDTGFALYLTLPREIISDLGLVFLREREVQLATGDFVIVREFRGWVLWDGIQRPIRVQETDGNSLVGVAMFHGYHLCIEMVDGGEVVIKPL